MDPIHLSVKDKKTDTKPVAIETHGSSGAHQSIANGTRSWWVDPLKNTVAGMVGAVAGKLIEFPADTLKTRVQIEANTKDVKRFNGPLECLQQTVRNEGFFGLYKGMSPALVGTMLETSCLFTANAAIKDAIRPEGVRDANLPMNLILLSGAGSGAAAAIVLTPVELIKVRLQSQMAGAVPKWNGPIHCLIDSIRREGPQVIYRGIVPTLFREIPGTAAWFGLYEASMRAMNGTESRENVPAHTTILSGALGGMGYWLANYPADTVKSAIQAGQTNGEHRFFPVLRSMYHKVGLPGLYAGVSTTMIRAAPANAAVFWTYEWAMRVMKDL